MRRLLAVATLLLLAACQGEGATGPSLQSLACHTQRVAVSDSLVIADTVRVCYYPGGGR